MFINSESVPEEKWFFIKWVRPPSVKQLILNVHFKRGLSSIENEWLSEGECQRLCAKAWTRMVGKFMGIWNRSHNVAGTSRTVCQRLHRSAYFQLLCRASDV